MKFERSLEMAQKQLRETSNGAVNGVNGVNGRLEPDPAATKANLPLTDRTKRLTLQNGEHGAAPTGGQPQR